MALSGRGPGSGKYGACDPIRCRRAIVTEITPRIPESKRPRKRVTSNSKKIGVRQEESRSFSGLACSHAWNCPRLLGGMKDNFQEGVELFNRARFFAAHEAWEELWLQSQQEEKRFLQGLIQLAAAFHHFQRGNLKGTRSLMEAAVAKMQAFRPSRRGLDLQQLMTEVEHWQAFCRPGSPAATNPKLPFPRLEAVSDNPAGIPAAG